MAQRITSPFGTFSTAREVVAGQDLSGRTVLITGAATGIGVETARALAEAGAEVVIAARKPDLAAQAVEDIDRTATGPGARFEMLDLSRLDSVRELGARWGDRPLHLLINNAGVMACPLDRTADGLEMQVGTNHFGHFLLGVLLAPALERGAQARGAPSRLVSLSSIGHRRSDIVWDDIHYRTRPYEKWGSYGQAKTANSLFAVGFNRRFAGRGINANAVMPGGIMTPLQRHMAREEMVALGWIDPERASRPRSRAPPPVPGRRLDPNWKGSAASTWRTAPRLRPGRRRFPWRGSCPTPWIRTARNGSGASPSRRPAPGRKPDIDPGNRGNGKNRFAR
jgi:NAD(P)-dependent dehydrogenase (short-subunit alcohol dehydrogenase family)